MRRACDLVANLHCVSACQLVKSARCYCTAATPWFREGLKFRCTECGKCCRKTTHAGVLVNAAEQAAIAGHLNITLERFQSTYLVPGCGTRLQRPALLLLPRLQSPTPALCTASVHT